MSKWLDHKTSYPRAEPIVVISLEMGNGSVIFRSYEASTTTKYLGPLSLTIIPRTTIFSLLATTNWHFLTYKIKQPK